MRLYKRLLLITPLFAMLIACGGGGGNPDAFSEKSRRDFITITSSLPESTYTNAECHYVAKGNVTGEGVNIDFSDLALEKDALGIMWSVSVSETRSEAARRASDTLNDNHLFTFLNYLMRMPEQLPEGYIMKLYAKDNKEAFKVEISGNSISDSVEINTVMNIEWEKHGEVTSYYEKTTSLDPNYQYNMEETFTFTYSGGSSTSSGGGSGSTSHTSSNPHQADCDRGIHEVDYNHVIDNHDATCHSNGTYSYQCKWCHEAVETYENYGTILEHEFDEDNVCKLCGHNRYDNGVIYEVNNDGTASVVGFNYIYTNSYNALERYEENSSAAISCSDVTIDILDEYEGHPVTTIKSDAFAIDTNIHHYTKGFTFDENPQNYSLSQFLLFVQVMVYLKNKNIPLLYNIP